MPKEKGRISARGLDEDVVEEFRRFVSDQYGKLHTVFGQELQKAMELYMQEKNTHTHEMMESKENAKSIGERRLAKVERDLDALGLRMAINNGGEVYEETIKKIMRKSVGLDPRTISKYFKAFCEKNELEVNREGALIKL